MWGKNRTEPVLTINPQCRLFPMSTAELGDLQSFLTGVKRENLLLIDVLLVHMHPMTLWTCAVATCCAEQKSTSVVRHSGLLGIVVQSCGQHVNQPLIYINQ